MICGRFPAAGISVDIGGVGKEEAVGSIFAETGENGDPAGEHDDPVLVAETAGNPA